MKAKEDWRDFLESGTYENLWVTNKYISGLGHDGGKTRIPTLKLTASELTNGSPGEVVTNKDKREVLGRLMFPKKHRGEQHPTIITIPSGWQ